MKPKALLLSIIAILVAETIAAQPTHTIEIKPDRKHLHTVHFYIDNVVDGREDTSRIGMVEKGFFNVRQRAVLEGGFSIALLRYFNGRLVKGPEKTPVVVVFKKFSISEVKTGTTEYGHVDIEADFYRDGEKVFSAVQHVESHRDDVTGQHPRNIKIALEKIIADFEKAYQEGNLLTDENTEAAVNEGPQEKEGLSEKEGLAEHERKGSRNVLALGYQIGGLSLIGVDYEIRIHDYFGVHFGAGMMGFTAGVNFHTNESRNSPFFNFSFKDGGFGLIQLGALEFGGRIPFSKEGNFALHGQVGVADILMIDKAFSEQLFRGQPVPHYMLSIGIGFSWTL